MRGEEQHSPAFFSYLRLEDRVPADHPLRAIRELIDTALAELSFRGDYYASESYRAVRLAILLSRTLSDSAAATQCS